MLSDREQRALRDIERSFADVEEETPRGRWPRARSRRVWMGDRPWVLVAVVGVGAASVFLIIAGVASGGLALAVAGAFGWLLRRYWPWLRDQGVLPWSGDEAVRGGSAPARVTRPSGIFHRGADWWPSSRRS